MIAFLAAELLDSPHRPRPTVTTHPPTSERLSATVRLAQLDDENLVYAVGAVALQFAVAQYSRDAARYDEVGGTFRVMFEHFLDVYARRHEGNATTA